MEQAETRFSSSRMERRFARLGWVTLTVLVVAGLAGLLGPGPLSWATAYSPGALIAVEYQRVRHREADGSLTLRIAGEASRNQPGISDWPSP